MDAKGNFINNCYQTLDESFGKGDFIRLQKGDDEANLTFEDMVKLKFGDVKRKTLSRLIENLFFNQSLFI